MADVVKNSGEIENIPSQVMICNEEEAAIKQIQQVGISACGATAALNVLSVFDVRAEVSDVIEAVHTRLRDLEAPLPQYLMSRSVAGTTHEDIIDGIKVASKDDIIGRFFHFYPERKVDISMWLKKWLLQGGIPVATLNCQKVPYSDGTIPDAWHHQMVCGVSDNGIHMTNPCQVITSDELWAQLCSESVLLIRRSDVLKRWNVNMDMNLLQENQEWTELGVSEQIDRLIKEETLIQLYGSELKNHELATAHITIPAAYKSGITIFAKRNSLASEYLELENELPLKIFVDL